MDFYAQFDGHGKLTALFRVQDGDRVHSWTPERPSWHPAPLPEDGLRPVEARYVARLFPEAVK